MIYAKQRRLIHEELVDIMVDMSGMRDLLKRGEVETVVKQHVGVVERFLLVSVKGPRVDGLGKEIGWKEESGARTLMDRIGLVKTEVEGIVISCPG